MEVLILTFVILGLVIIGMSVGVILSNKPIKGSCGGMASLGMDTVCDICGGDPNKCDEEDGSSNTPKKGVELGKEL